MIIRPEHFTHLHIHSNHSTKDGSIPVRDIIDLQVERGSKAVALTDHGTMTGSWFLYDHIKNIKKYDALPIIGLEAYLSYTRNELNTFLSNPKQIEDKDQRTAKRKQLAKKYHQILLAKNKTGYFNLIKIHNDGWKNGFYYNPTTTPETIFANHEGIIATTTCLASYWNQCILSGNLQEAEKELYRWKDVFRDDFYVELQPINFETQRLVNIELIRLAKRVGIKTIITNDVHYVEEHDHNFHYILLNMSRLKQEDFQEDQKMWEFNVDDLYLKTLDQMKASWKSRHKGQEFTESVFDDSIAGVAEIISKIEPYSLENKPLLPNLADVPSDELLSRVMVGFKAKLAAGIIPRDKIKEYQDRIIYELKVLNALESENYILLCSDITKFAIDNGIGRGVGRGSAAGSLVLYLLGITQIDSLKYGIPFERFQSLSRRMKLKM